MISFYLLWVELWLKYEALASNKYLTHLLAVERMVLKDFEKVAKQVCLWKMS